MRKLEWIFLLLGLVLFVFLLERIGWRTLLEQFERIGWYFGVVLLVSAGRYLARTLAWRAAFAGRAGLPSLGEMFGARLAGQALGYLTFAGPLLSEPTKAFLLRAQLPLAAGLGGTLLEASAYAFTSSFIILVGLMVALTRLALERELARAGWIVAALLALAWLGGRWLLRRRIHFLSVPLALFQRAAWAEKRRPRVAEIEDHLFNYYEQHTGAFRLMFLWDLSAQVFALLEIYVVLRALGFAVSWTDILVIEGLGKIIGTMFFFVPGRVGTDEAGNAAIFELLGYGMAAGVSLALVQRLRAIFWTAPGLVLLAGYALRRGPARPSS